MTKTVLVIGWADEPTLSHLVRELSADDRLFHLLDLNSFREANEIEINDNGVELRIRIDDITVDFERFDAYFVRAWWRDLGDHRKSSSLQHALSHIFAFLEHCSGLVANPPSAGLANAFKLRQLFSLREHGFRIPSSFVTSDPETAFNMVSPDGDWIFKGPSQHRTITRELSEQAFFRMKAIEHRPILFQERIFGNDVRVHVVGKACLGLEIKTSAIDYRYPGEEVVEYRPVEIPLNIQMQCLHYCETERLIFSGIDFKVARDSGEWFVLEANPMPAFNFYDPKLDKRISKALIELLTGQTDDPYGRLETVVEGGLIAPEDRPHVWR